MCERTDDVILGLTIGSCVQNIGLARYSAVAAAAERLVSAASEVA